MAGAAASKSKCNNAVSEARSSATPSAVEDADDALLWIACGSGQPTHTMPDSEFDSSKSNSWSNHLVVDAGPGVDGTESTCSESPRNSQLEQPDEEAAFLLPRATRRPCWCFCKCCSWSCCCNSTTWSCRFMASFCITSVSMDFANDSTTARKRLSSISSPGNMACMLSSYLNKGSAALV